MGGAPRGALAFAAVGIVSACTIVERTDRDGADDAPVARGVVEVAGVGTSPDVSPAVRSGGLLFVSGQIGLDGRADPPRLVAGGIEAETRQAMENVMTVLAAAGATPADVVKCTVFLVQVEDYPAMNRVYREYFPVEPPARSTVAVSGLVRDALVEIECVAEVPEGG